ncbi:DUF354 domain-containing protein [Natrinema marinum]|uniref:DUF354 domain-containing protein n=1 Tax=Natrinema marinum TaxID=2961598 RepID=UPI0020C865C6|nr:DUF354 domain-containing protein [Natrinema marinum]
MRVLFDITHPAHVHLFKNAIRELWDSGHHVLVTARGKDITVPLLESYGIPHVVLSSKSSGIVGTVSEWLLREVRLARIATEFDPDVIVSRFNPAGAHASKVVGCPFLMLDDTENESSLIKNLTYPLADAVFTPSCFELELGDNQIRYDGYHELAYLHPDRFTPDEAALRDHDIDPDGEYYVIRLTAWDAFHDYGASGVSQQTLSEIVSLLSDRGSVYITSEGSVPSALADYGLEIPPCRIHDLLAFANGYIGDSGTMATEAAILGTPAIRIDPLAGRHTGGNFVELEERYGLLRSTPHEREAVRELRAQVSDPRTAEKHREGVKRLLDDKIDVTAFLLDRIRSVTNDSDPKRTQRNFSQGEATKPRTTPD